ncbi:MAG TPA: UPF0182 family protein [Gemmatimonadaceae bacterium]
MNSRRWLVVLVATVAILLLAGRILSAWYVDYQWFAVQGAMRLWWVRAADLAILRGGVFAAVFIFSFLNLIAVRRSIRSLRLPRRIGNLEFSEEVSARILNRSAAILSVVVALAFAMPHNDWQSVELIRHGLPFGETDPYFRLDLGAWLYELPLESSLHVWALIALLAMTLLVVFLYALTPSLRWDEGRLHVTGHVRRHMSVLAGVLLILLAWGYRLNAYGLLYDGTGPSGALSAVDHRLGIPANLALAMLAIASAMLVTWAGWVGQTRVAFVTITVMLLAALTVRQVVPAVGGRFVTAEDPEAQEQSYRAIRNAYSRRAYAVDALERVALAEFPSFEETLRGASLWDRGAMRRIVSGSRPGARPNGSLGWHGQDGRLVAFALEQPVGPQAVDSLVVWGINRVAADVTDDRGAPVTRETPDAPPSLRGVLVHDSATSYFVLSDTGGRTLARPLNSFVARLAHAWHLQNPSLLSGRRNVPAAVLLRRDVRERVRELYPFFAQGQDVTPVVWRDSVLWAVHVYSASDWYPLSTPQRWQGTDVRFVQMAGVAIVNGHTGSTTVLSSPHAGPMALSWMRRFPELFSDPSTLDMNLLVRLPPADDGAMLVSRVLAEVGLRGEFDARAHLPAAPGDSGYSPAEPAPWLNRTTGAVGVAIPLLDPTEDVRGVVVASGGGDFRFRWVRNPASALRWTRLVSALRSATDSLHAGEGATRPLSGPLRILPTAEGFVGVQTQYVVRPDGVPLVLVAGVARPNAVAIGQSLIDAAGLPHPVVAESPMTPEDFRRRVAALYESMREAMRRGDWAGIGAAYEALGRLLRSPPP